MPDRPLKIVLTGGGTAGHVMPNLALLPLLRQSFKEIHYIGTNAIEKQILQSYPEIRFHEITSVKLVRGGGLKNALIPFRLVKAILAARRVLRKIEPDIVFSKGGYVALPVAIAAKCPVITHESDLSMGLANKLIAKKCAAILTSFPTEIKGAICTGAPIRTELLTGNKNKLLRLTGFSGARPILLVMGGSLGATAINQAVRGALETLTKKYDVLHLTGRGNAVQSLNCAHYRQLEFCNQMGDVYASASLAVSRAGSNSLSELAAVKIPTLLIPLPKGSSRGDQLDNASYMKKRGMFEVLSQSDLTPASLQKAVDDLQKSAPALKKALSSLSQNGCENVHAQILAHLNK